MTISLSLSFSPSLHGCPYSDASARTDEQRTREQRENALAQRRALVRGVWRRHAHVDLVRWRRGAHVTQPRRRRHAVEASLDTQTLKKNTCPSILNQPFHGRRFLGDIHTRPTERCFFFSPAARHRPMFGPLTPRVERLGRHGVALATAVKNAALALGETRALGAFGSLSGIGRGRRTRRPLGGRRGTGYLPSKAEGTVVLEGTNAHRTWKRALPA